MPRRHRRLHKTLHLQSKASLSQPTGGPSTFKKLFTKYTHLELILLLLVVLLLLSLVISYLQYQDLLITCHHLELSYQNQERQIRTLFETEELILGSTSPHTNSFYYQAVLMPLLVPVCFILVT